MVPSTRTQARPAAPDALNVATTAAKVAARRVAIPTGFLAALVDAPLRALPPIAAVPRRRSDAAHAGCALAPVGAGVKKVAVRSVLTRSFIASAAKLAASPRCLPCPKLVAVARASEGQLLVARPARAGLAVPARVEKRLALFVVVVAILARLVEAP